MQTREAIFAEIAQERERQDTMFGGPEHDDQHTASDWGAIIMRHLGLAFDDGKPADICLMNDHCAGWDPQRFRRQMIRVAAIAEAAVETWERKTDDALKTVARLAQPDPLVRYRRMAQDEANRTGEPVLLVVNPLPTPIEHYDHRNSQGELLPYVTLLSQADPGDLEAAGTERFEPH